MKYIDVINGLIKWGKENVSDFKENDLSDGYHTFNELYEFRKMYNAVLFNEWAKSYDPIMSGASSEFRKPSQMRPHYNVHKSKRHHDGELCFGGGWFIVSAKLPSGLISNHYKMQDWDLFRVPETEKAIFEFDGHTGKDVLLRLKDLIE